jgi:hypothetical protein
LLNCSLGDPWRDEERRDTATKTVKLIGIVFASRSLLSIGEVVRAGSKWGRNVVVETTSLIKGKDKESILRTSTERLVDLLKESLTIGD